MIEEKRRLLIDTRFTSPGAIAEVAQGRQRPPTLQGDEKILVVAADHSARGMLGVGRDAFAMENRYDLLDRLCVALANPGVHGVLGTPDIVEDLMLLGALENKLVFG